jgi:succinate dehydrogenase / fumarate reductase cytochrome b subunit
LAPKQADIESGLFMAANHPRPLSPHLSVWRWGPHMAVSILHRATGVALSIAGLAALTWWLMAIAGDASGFDRFNKAAHHPLGLIVLVGLTWSFFQHLLSGIRHLVMDTGSAFELGTNKRFAIATIIGSLILTAVLWVYLLGVRA